MSIYRIYGYYQPEEGRWYIGRTSRKYQSKRAGKNGIRYVQACRKFGEAIRKYGWDSFEYYPNLAQTEDLELSYELEKYTIEFYDSMNNGYNCSIGGKSSKKGCHLTEESKRRIGEAHRRKYGHSPSV